VAPEAPARRGWTRPSREALVATAAFTAFCVLVLVRRSALLEPDDYAYRASIVALAHGEILLTNAQYLALGHQLTGGIQQWHHLASGRWISEKNPGYPFFAVLFYLAGALRLAPLFYGALACFGLYAGASAWLGRRAGAYAVWLYCFSGAALTFAWRATMPSFTDASLIAAGAGALLWVMLTPATSDRHRLFVGLAAFVALEGAVFIRYTDLVELVVAVVGVLVFWRAVAISRAALITWMTSVAVFAVGVGAFDTWAYGHPTATGYSPGEISFSLSALGPNLRAMPIQLLRATPFFVLGAVTVVGVAVTWTRTRHGGAGRARRDVAVAGVLAAGWLGLWLLYFTYTWTVGHVAPVHAISPAGAGPVLRGVGAGSAKSAITVHVVRFYLPALGPIALLGAWTLSKAARLLAVAALAAIVALALVSYQSMASSRAAGPHPPGATNSPAPPPYGPAGRIPVPGGAPPDANAP
jgi:hypothetical protein